MIKSLHIGRYVAKLEDLRKIAEFFQAIGMEEFPDRKGSVIFASPQGLISFNQPSASHPPHLSERLKDVAKLIVLEVSNPDDVLAIASRMKFPVLADVAPSN